MTTDTQFESWEALQATLNEKQLKVFFVIAEKPSTGAEVADKMGVRRDWITPRISELQTLGMVEDSQIRRKNFMTGKNNIVWRKFPGDYPKPRMKRVKKAAWAELDDKGDFLRAYPANVGAYNTPCVITYFKPGK